jgi:hypothetical protein
VFLAEFAGDRALLYDCNIAPLLVPALLVAAFDGPTQIFFNTVPKEWGLDMLDEGTSDSGSLHRDELKSVSNKTESDSVIPVSLSESDACDRKFDDRMKAAFIKLVCGG